MSKFKNEDENSSKVNKKINKNKQILNDKNNIQKQDQNGHEQNNLIINDNISHSHIERRVKTKNHNNNQQIIEINQSLHDNQSKNNQDQSYKPNSNQIKNSDNDYILSINSGFMSNNSAMPDRFIEQSNSNVNSSSNVNQRSKSQNNKTKAKKEFNKQKSQIKQFIDKDKQKYKLLVNDLHGSKE